MTSNAGRDVLKSLKVSVPARGLISKDICSNDKSDSYGTVKLTTAENARLSGVIVRTGSGNRYRIASTLR